jgi:DME family drug/metabolite transporter
VRIAIGAVGLLVLAAARDALPSRALAARPPTLLAGAAMAAYQLLLFSGVRRTGVALGTVVGIGSTPVWAGLLGWSVRRERPSVMWFAGTALAIGGAALLLGGGEDADTLGIAFTAGAGLAYAIYTTAVKVLTDRGERSEQVVAATFVIGGVLLFPVLLAGDAEPLLSWGGVALALWLGLASVTLSYFLFGLGITGVSVATTATLTLAEPLTAATLGVVVLDEALTATSATGMAMIVAGLLVVGRGPD